MFRRFDILRFIKFGFAALIVAGGVGASQAAEITSAKVSLLEEECPAEFSLRANVVGLKNSANAAQVVFHYKNEANYLCAEITTRQATLIKVQNSKPTILSSEFLRVSSDGLLPITIQRRFWKISLLCGEKTVARGYDSDMSGGNAGWRATGGATVDGLRLQELAPIYFTDDFTRGGDESTQWDVLAGRCRVAEIAAGTHDGVVGRHSSNAFSWVAQAQPLALSSAGQWYWSDYAAEACVQPSEQQGAVGIAVCLKDARNYLLFRWTTTTPGRPDSGTREIVRVADDKRTMLASSPGGFKPRQWYRMRFVAREGSLSAYIDGQLVCSAKDDSFGQGKVGLFAQNCQDVTFDDVRVVSIDGFHDEFGRPEPGKWTDFGVAWKTQLDGRCRTAIQDGEGLTVTGRTDWENYVVAAETRPGRSEQVGLVFACQNSKNYFLFLSPVVPGQKPQIVRVSDGNRTVLAEGIPTPTAGASRLKVDLSKGRIRGFINNQIVVQTVDPLCRNGKVGFYAKGTAGARFANVVVWIPQEEIIKPRVEAQFAKEDTMAGWASERGSWRADSNNVLWHTGEFFGDSKVSIELPSGNARLSGVLAINADGQSLETGYQLLAAITPDGQTKLELKRCGATVAVADGKWGGDAENRELRLWREGSLVAGSAGGSVAVSYSDPSPLKGVRVGVKKIEGEIPVDALDATSSNLLDCTFAGPPAEWWSPRGEWEVSQRWPCDNRWSFFGGLKSESPMLWTKQSFNGDMVAEAWVAVYMDNIEDPVVGYRHPADLNLSICGNGKDVSSGYSFMFAAANNTVTRIMRKDQVVSQTAQVRMVNPVRTNLAFQRHWFHLRAEKHGNQIRFFVDGQPAGAYTDANPIPGGQVALWTWKNGLMVARARVWYEKDGGLCVLPVVKAIPVSLTQRPDGANSDPWLVANSSPLMLTSDFEHGTEGWTTEASDEAPVLTLDGGSHSQGRKSLRIVNRVSGGDMTVWCGIKRFDAAKFPSLQFDYQMDAAARINIYLRVRQRWMVIGFSAPGYPGEGVIGIGAIPGVAADGEWHTAQFDLLSALKRVFPGDSSLTVEDLCFASPRVEYLRSGFGGNYWGTEYHLDNFRLLGTKTTTVEDGKQIVMRTGPGVSG